MADEQPEWAKQMEERITKKINENGAITVRGFARVQTVVEDLDDRLKIVEAKLNIAARHETKQ